MDAREAANAIRPHVDFDHEQKISAEDRHQINFVTDVCNELGLDANVVWFAYIQDLLAKQKLVHQADEFPKMATNDDGQPILDPVTKQPIVFQSKDDQDAAAAVRAAQDAAAHGSAPAKRKGKH
jgi:hypothetical protein